MQIIAEGVETDGQLAALGAIGCDIAQGYLTGAPMPPDDFARLLARQTLD